jgi:heptosyltransferase-2/heptosyltransferase-3
MRFLKLTEQRGKQLLIKLLSVFLPVQKEIDTAELQRRHFNRILIIRLEQKLGNLVMSTFFPRALKDMFPQSTVHLFVHNRLKSVWDNNPFVDCIITFDHKYHLYNPIRFVQLLRQLRNNRYDLVIDLSTPGGFSLSNGLLTTITGAPYRAGFQRGESVRFLNISVPPELNKHYIELENDILRKFRPDVKMYKPEMFLSENEIQTALKKLSSIQRTTDDKLVFLWIGARDKKQWDTKCFIALKNILEAESGACVVILCGPGEIHWYNQLTLLYPNKTIYVDDFRLLAGLISQCDLYVSGDAGPLHLAVALNRKTLGIYLQKNYSTYGYNNGIQHRVVDLSENPGDVKTVAEHCKVLLYETP